MKRKGEYLVLEAVGLVDDHVLPLNGLEGGPVGVDHLIGRQQHVPLEVTALFISISPLNLKYHKRMKYKRGEGIKGPL